MFGFKKIGFLYFCFLFVISFVVTSMSNAADHLIAVSHKNDVDKKIAVYEPDGNLVFSYAPSGSVMENTPRFIQAIPSANKFFVTCPNGDAETGGSVEVFEYSGNPSVVRRVQTLETGAKPFHAYVTPDNLFCVSNDGDETFSLIDPLTLTVETIAGGYHHATIGFPITESGYDIYASRFYGAGNPGGVDIVDGVSREIRTTDSEILPLPHSVVYSPATKKVYIACAGGIEIFGTVGDEKDVRLATIPTTEGHMTPALKLSPDGRYIVGNCHWDGESGSYFYSINLETEEMKTVSSVSCKGYAYSPDGKWIVAGDFNKPSEQEIQKVHVINCDPASPDYMTVVKEISLSSPSQVGFFAHGFSPDSTVAYLGLTQSDTIMLVDVTTLSVSEFDCEAAPFILSVLPLNDETHVSTWPLH